MRSFAQNGSARGALSGNLEAILASLLGGGPDMSGAKSIAKGSAAIFAKLDELSREKGVDMPPDYITELKKQIGDAENVELYELGDGNHVIAATVLTDGHDAFGGDLGPFGRGGRRESLFDSIGSRRRRPQETKIEPFSDFLKVSVDALKPPQQKADRPMAFDFSLAAMLASCELMRYPRNAGNAAPRLAGAFAKLVADSEIKDGVKFKNLGSYLDVYGIRLKGLAERLRQFETRPQPDEAEALARELAHLGIVMVSVSRDAIDKAEASQKALLNI